MPAGLTGSGWTSFDDEGEVSLDLQRPMKAASSDMLPARTRYRTVGVVPGVMGQPWAAKRNQRPQRCVVTTSPTLGVRRDPR